MIHPDDGDGSLSPEQQAWVEQRRERVRANKRRHYQENRERLLAKQIERQATRKEEKSTYDKARYQAKREEILAYKAGYRQANLEKERAADRAYYRRARDQWRRSQLRQRYGITLEEYTAMGERQGWRCAMCGVPAQDATGGRLHVDHDHALGHCRAAVRELLCHGCNTRLAALEYDMAWLRAAMRYLRHWRDAAEHPVLGPRNGASGQAEHQADGEVPPPA